MNALWRRSNGRWSANWQVGDEQAENTDGDRQLDFFNACYADIPIRDQRDTMERPFFSLAKKPRRTPISYQVNGTALTSIP